MLFNSYAYIFAYLPISLFAFYFFAQRNPRHASLFLVVASFIFYGWWNSKYVILLLISIVFNYSVGMQLAKEYEHFGYKRKHFLIIGLFINLILLAYYKYANFFIDNLNIALKSDISIQQIILPIGISFFTFTQIAFLIDASRGLAKEYDFLDYCLFVTYFPHLIAGPVLHHKEMMPQFSNPETYKISYLNIASGLTLFTIGLFKKLVLADNISVYATPVFEAAAKGEHIATFEAWGGSLAYTLQIYFDFSGYTDMAIGASKMFGVNLPINFDSPYKANSIIEFWRRWHMSLSRFLRDYLYIPLGGNRKGEIRRLINLMITMVLGGLWHGSNWTFIIWGCLHGIFLIINHVFQRIWKFGYQCRIYTFASGFLSKFITFIAIVFAWVFFRSNSLQTAIMIIKGMLGINGTLIPLKWVEDGEQNAIIQWMLAKGCTPASSDTLFTGTNELWIISIMLVICWFFPNTSEIFVLNRNYIQPFWRWKPSKTWLIVTIFMGFFAILSISDMSEFIYFQF